VVYVDYNTYVTMYAVFSSLGNGIASAPLLHHYLIFSSLTDSFLI